jgi:hypothetical protein
MQTASKSGSLNFVELSGRVQTCTGIALRCTCQDSGLLSYSPTNAKSHLPLEHFHNRYLNFVFHFFLTKPYTHFSAAAQPTILKQKKLNWHWHSDGYWTSVKRWKHARPRIWWTSGVGGTKWNVDQELPLASTRSVSFSSRVNAPLFVASFRFWYENIPQFKCTVVGRIPNTRKHTSPHQTSVLSLSRSRTRGTKPPIHGAVLTSQYGQLWFAFQSALVGFDIVRDRTEQLQVTVLNSYRRLYWTVTGDCTEQLQVTLLNSYRRLYWTVTGDCTEQLQVTVLNSYRRLYWTVTGDCTEQLQATVLNS